MQIQVFKVWFFWLNLCIQIVPFGLGLIQLVIYFCFVFRSGFPGFKISPVQISNHWDLSV